MIELLSPSGHSNNKYFVKYRFNTPYLYNVIKFRHPAASSSIEITEIDLGFLQYKLDFTRHVDIYSI